MQLKYCKGNFTAYIETRKKVINDIPDFLSMASNALKKRIMKHTSFDVNPDILYLAYFGYSNLTSPLWSVTLTGAVLVHFHELVQNIDSNKLNTYFRITYYNNTLFEGKIRPDDLRYIIRQVNFASLVKDKLKAFWVKHEEDWRTLAKAEFLRAAHQAKKNGLLTEKDYSSLIQGLAPGVSQPITLRQLYGHESFSGVQVQFLSINGYFSNDILRISLENRKEILYIPSIGQEVFYQFTDSEFLLEGNQVFYVFNEDTTMRNWVVNQAKDIRIRFLLARHFNIYDRQDGILYTGVVNSLKKLAEGIWNSQSDVVNGGGDFYFTESGMRTISGPFRNSGEYKYVVRDVFHGITYLTKQRTLQESATLVLPREGSISNPLFYFEIFERAVGQIFMLCSPIAASLKILNFTAFLKYKTVASHKTFKDVEGAILNEMGVLFGALSQVVDKNNRRITTCKGLHARDIKKGKPSYYEDILAKFPDLETQLKKPDPLVLNHDRRAVDDINRFSGTEKIISNLLVRSNCVYTKSEVGNTVNLAELHFEFSRCDRNLQVIMDQAYKKSPTFRRLFNYAYDKELHNPEKRWGIMPMTTLRTLALGEQFGDERIRLLELYPNTEALKKKFKFYQSGLCLVPFSMERVYLRQVVKALTLLPDNVSKVSIRGPVVEYTNLILKEMNLAEPVRTQYINQLADIQLAILQGKNCINYAVYLQLRNNITSAMPNFSEIARSFMRAKIKERTGLDLDTDKVYLNYFGNTQKQYSSLAFLKWSRDVQPQWSITLTTLAFTNFNSDDEFCDANKLNEKYGVYWHGSGCDHYGAENEVRIKPSTLRDISWKLDFASIVNQKLNEFWTKHHEDWRTLAKAEFLRAALDAKIKGILSNLDYTRLLKGIVPDLPLTEPLTLFLLQQKTSPLIDVRRLDINGYSATDILRFVLEDGREILYIPGHHPAFYSFDNDHKMRLWLVKQATDLKKRLQLTAHFSMYDRQDGNTYTGVDNALQKLVEGDWEIDGTGIDYKNLKIESDIFDALALQTKKCRFNNAKTLIMSNQELSEQRTLMAFQMVAMVFSIPLMFFGSVGVVLGTAIFATTFGLELHIAVNGDSLEERKGAFRAAEMDVAMAALFGAVANIGSRYISFNWEAIQRIKSKKKFFIKPQSINGKMGYPLGPVKPPQFLVEEKGLKVAENPSENVKMTESPSVKKKFLEEQQRALSVLPESTLKEVLPDKQKQALLRKVLERTSKTPALSKMANSKSLVNKNFRPYYKKLYQDVPELKKQLDNPDPLLLRHDEIATDSSNRFPAVNEEKIIKSFLQSKEGMGYFDFPKLSKILWNRRPHEYMLLKQIMHEAYYNSPTFRRLYNYAYDAVLQYPEERWLIAPNEVFRTTITEEDFLATNKKKVIGLNVDFINCRYYQSGDTITPLTAERAYLQEVIKALTGIHYEPSEEFFRGPIVEYTNIVLKEIGRSIPHYSASPVRTSYLSSLSKEQLKSIAHYKALSQKFPELKLQTQKLDPFLLDHDHMAVDGENHYNTQVFDVMFKEQTGSIMSLYGSPPNALLAKETAEYKILGPLLNKAYKESLIFRRLYNKAKKTYKWENQENRVLLAPNSNSVFSTTYSYKVTEEGVLEFNPNSKLIIFLSTNLENIGKYKGIKNTFHKFTLNRAYMHEVVHVLTGLKDSTSAGHPRGPVVEYTNFILSEMGVQDPVRVAYYCPPRRPPRDLSRVLGRNETITSDIDLDFDHNWRWPVCHTCYRQGVISISLV
ncbi:hypothetical protein Zmor_011829 [Zophobas morio]|uniref:Dermonecrotic toxin N-terminal domain-containing protein n=1 Tax=Zophobas morio TaxID=2755281 RepID=A0AA38LYQ9_9CUCU|nr:hypothetical protein Zmor_011829 [Zophobas morio]